MSKNALFPFVSVIIPVCNGGEAFQRCLQALQATTYSGWECIVVDDGSTDESMEVASRYGMRVMSSGRIRGGPAAARNLGAKVARGEILFFIDADVLVQPDTVGRMASNFQANSAIFGAAACFGSYDETPADPNFLSQYKNLQHHYVHQASNEEASTFWTGCGAIRRDIFLEMDGFSTSYARPSIEDIELGYRLRAKGYRIGLDKQLQVKHLKRWTARSLVLTDIRDRAIPWTRLILREGNALNDLNLQTTQRFSVVATFTGITALLMSILTPWAMWLVGLSIIILLALNGSFYRFLANRKGIRFALQALPWHWLYFAYSGLCFAIVWLGFKLSNVGERLKKRREEALVAKTRRVSAISDKS